MERRDFESVVGANWLAVAGITVLVLGVAFFLKYAFEHDWIGLNARIALGVVTGIGLVAGGDALARRKGYGTFPHVLAGGGAAIAYFSVFSAHHFEPYRAATGLTAGAGALLLALVALAFAAYATWRDAPALAGVGVALAGITAFVANAWTDLGVAYAVILGVALAGASALRSWAHVALLAATVTFVVLTVDAFVEDAAPVGVLYGSLVAAAAFAGAGVAMTRGAREPQLVGTLPLVPLLAGVGGWLVALAALHAEDATGSSILDARPGADAWLTLGVAVALLALAWVTRRTPHGYATGAAVAGVVALLVWPALQFDERIVPTAWAALAALGAALLVAPGAPARKLARYGALVAGGLAALTLAALAGDWFPPVDNRTFALNWLAYGGGVAALAFAWHADRTAQRGDASGTRVDRLHLAGALLVLSTWLGHGLDGYWISAAWATAGLMLMGAGFVWGLQDVRVAALALFALTLGRLFTIDLATLDLGWRIVAFLVVGSLLLAASALYARERKRESVG